VGSHSHAELTRLGSGGREETTIKHSPPTFLYYCLSVALALD